jgi:2-polyprenyl-3-methyl-5-hydroxy-6-metoxy-1,4-benzoquinol methylase
VSKPSLAGILPVRPALKPSDGIGETLHKVVQTRLARDRDEIARRHGAWQTNLPLGHGVWTITGELTADQTRLMPVVQAAADALDRPLAEARVLDLGAAEGQFAVEFALHGAGVVAVEGRLGNVEKARFVKDVLALDRVEIVHGDVRSLSFGAYGEFDLVLCMGILYHLDGPSAIDVVHRIAAVCRRATIVETQVSLAPRTPVRARGRVYWGRRVREFDPRASTDEQAGLGRSAIGNPESLWLTRASLYNLLTDAGYSSVMELHAPRAPHTRDRVTLVAFHGNAAAVVSRPQAGSPWPSRWRERERLPVHPNQTWRGEVKRRLAPYVPRRLRAWLRRVHGTD